MLLDFLKRIYRYQDLLTTIYDPSRLENWLESLKPFTSRMVRLHLKDIQENFTRLPIVYEEVQGTWKMAILSFKKHHNPLPILIFMHINCNIALNICDTVWGLEGLNELFITSSGGNNQVQTVVTNTSTITASTPIATTTATATTVVTPTVTTVATPTPTTTATTTKIATPTATPTPTTTIPSRMESVPSAISATPPSSPIREVPKFSQKLCTRFETYICTFRENLSHNRCVMYPINCIVTFFYDDILSINDELLHYMKSESPPVLSEIELERWLSNVSTTLGNFVIDARQMAENEMEQEIFKHTLSTLERGMGPLIYAAIKEYVFKLDP